VPELYPQAVDDFFVFLMYLKEETMNVSGMLLVVLPVILVFQCIDEPFIIEGGQAGTPKYAIPVSSTNIDSSLSQPNDVAIIEFYSEKCQICANLSWVIDSMHSALMYTAFVGAHNIDRDSLWKRFSVTTVPTYILFKSGKEITRRSFSNPGSYVLDTLTALARSLIAGTLLPDSSDVMSVNVSNVNKLLTAAGGVAVIELYSENSNNSNSLAWVIDSLFSCFGDSVFFGVNNTDHDLLWKRYSVTAVPTYLLFRSGKEVARRRFSVNKPEVFDTLAGLIQQLCAGTLTSDTTTRTQPPDPENYLTLTDSTFNSAALQKNATSMVLFIDTTKMECIYMDSVIRSMAPQFSGRAVIAKVHAPGLDLKYQYDIYQLPEVLFFQKGIEEGFSRRDGIVTGDTLSVLLESVLSSKVVPMYGQNFSDSVLVNDRIAMVDFYSPTCGACRVLMPVVEAVADTFNGTALIAKVNARENDSLATALEVDRWPTLIFFRNGVEYDRLIGSSNTFETVAARIRTGFDSVSALTK
jgi:thioredoxin-like negative regulator of GroEL